MNKKRISRLLGISLLAVTVVSSVSPIGVNAAWKQNKTGWWFTEGSSYATGWRKISGVWYYFDRSGYMKTGWVKDNGIWYYLDKSGAMKTGWVKDNGTWYYLDKSGAMKTGWVKDNGTWYYLEKSGAMKTGWVKHSGAWYYLEKSGAMKTGWVKYNSTWYYMEKDGAMKTGWLEENGKHYYLDDYNGDMKTGWYGRHPRVTYYFDKHGVSAIGETEINGKMYYFTKSTEENGGYEMVISAITDDYYYDSYGIRHDKSVLKVKDDIAALELIKANDSNFINNKESEDSDFKLNPNGYAQTSWHLFLFNYMDDMIQEPMHVISYGSATNFDVKSGFYAVGAVSGKVYCAGSEENIVYEIKDNQKVRTYQINNHTYLEFNDSDWR